ncbi:MAG: hypothetical protein H7177_01735 [Rhizobacter sp.]|nr:hypothetical protein [Bacteriovorax sp.]
MRKFLISAAVLTLSANAFSATLHRGGAELLNPGAYSISGTTSVFQTSAYYDTTGVETTKADGVDYKLIDVDFSVSYGISKNLQLTGFGRFRNVSSTANEISATKSGPESVGVEAKYGFDPVGAARWAVGAHYRQTAYKNTSYDTGTLPPADEIILGDAGSEYGVDLYLTYLMKSFKWDAQIGYSSPANNLSGEVNYKIEGMYRFTKLGLLAGLAGTLSLKNDPYADAPQTKPLQATGATQLFNSTDREKMAPYVGANYAFERVLVGVKGQTIVSGKSTDKGSAFSLNLTWSSEGVTPESVKVESFKEYQIEGSVLKISARGNFVRIDQGLSTDVEKGMKFDVYQTDYFGGNVLVASGIVYEVGADWSIIKLTKKYKEIEIKPGFAARGY